MPSRVAKTAQREARLVIVAQMLVEGYRPTAVAKATNVSPATITADKKTIFKRWQEETAAIIGKQREIVLRQNEWILHEAVMAWHTSQEDRKRTTQKVTEGVKKGRQRKEASETTEQSDGNPAFLQIAENALKTKRELLGLDQPQEVDVNVQHAGHVVHTAIGLQETVALLAQVADEADPRSLPTSMPTRLVLPAAVRAPSNGRERSMDSGQVQGSASEPERDD